MRTWLARLRPRSIYDVMAVIGCVAAVGTGTAYAANTVFSTDIVDGEVKNADIAGNSITSNRIYPGSVMTTDIANNAVDSSKVLDESLTANDLATNSVGATEIGDSTIDSGEIVNDSLFDTDLASGSVRSPEIQDGQVASADLGSNAVTSAKVASNTLTTADIAGAAVSGHINLNGIANGRCTQVDFSVSGAQPGDVAFVATGAAIQNGIVMSAARVKSANVVEVNACNFSGGAMNTISDFPVRVVTLR